MGEGREARWQSLRTLSSPTLMSTPKSQLTDEQSPIRKTEIYQKKDILHPKTYRGNHNKTAGGGTLVI